MASHALITAMRLGSVRRLRLPTWAGAMVTAATLEVRTLVSILFSLKRGNQKSREVGYRTDHA